MTIKKRTVLDPMLPTPNWAKWMFRVTFILTTAMLGWMEATDLFTDATKHEVTIFLKLFLDPLVYGLSKMFGLADKS